MYKSLSQTKVNYYNFYFLDTSAISLIDFSTEFTTYTVERTTPRLIPAEQGVYASYEVRWVQAPEQYHEIWAVESIDIVLGLVGGFSGILWSLLAILFGGYETFKLENSLIGAVYPTSPGGGDDNAGGSDIEGEQMARQALMQTIAERGKYFYGYTDYLVSSLARCFCSCCCANRGPGSWYARRMSKLDRHEKASERLA